METSWAWQLVLESPTAILVWFGESQDCLYNLAPLSFWVLNVMGTYIVPGNHPLSTGCSYPPCSSRRPTLFTQLAVLVHKLLSDPMTQIATYELWQHYLKMYLWALQDWSATGLRVLNRAMTHTDLKFARQFQCQNTKPVLGERVLNYKENGCCWNRPGKYERHPESQGVKDQISRLLSPWFECSFIGNSSYLTEWIKAKTFGVWP